MDGWTRLEPQPEACPRSIALPRADGTPHPLAMRAAIVLREQLGDPTLTRDVDFDAAGAGKMFGVLVVDAGADGIGFLRGFSGMLDRRWLIPGFVPPVFDVARMEAFWPAGEAELDAMTAVIESGALQPAALREMIDRRRARSRELWAQFQDTYRIADARGAVRTLAELFAPRLPPSGAGDCAAPKLLAHAYRHALQPLALAEMWWGAELGPRVHASFHAPCEHKCGPILTHMLG